MKLTKHDSCKKPNYPTAMVLGIPVDCLSMEQTIACIFDMVESYRQDQKPRLVTTVNVDFTVKSQGWLGKERHPELLKVLRNSQLSTADGMPIVWYSRLLGADMPGRVTGADLLPRLAAAAGRRGNSIYLLGGDPAIGRQAADMLREQTPGLNVAGVDSPFVHTVGHDLSTADLDDAPICERINAAAPDILFVAFGNPKQELWFNRNRNRLKVPVTIGIGGSFNFLTGAVARAPEWMRRVGLEWLHRLYSEPRRLFIRYALGMSKFCWMSAPALFLGGLDRLRTSQKRGGMRCSRRYYSGSRQIFLSDADKILTPACLAEAWGELESLERDDKVAIVLDLNETTGVSAVGLGALLRFLNQARAQDVPVFLLGCKRALRRRFKHHRVLDVVEPYLFGSAGAIAQNLQWRWRYADCFISVDSSRNGVAVGILGCLDLEQVEGVDRAGFAALAGARDCVVDMRYCSEIDGSGVGLLKRLQLACIENKATCMIANSAKSGRKVFTVCGVEKDFIWC